MTTKRLLRQNTELRPHRIWNWTIPAWIINLPDGSRFNTCPHAGICAQYCYARNGTYQFSNVRSAHMSNLMRVLDDPEKWVSDMNNELQLKCFKPTGIQRNLPIKHEHLDPYMLSWVENGGAAVRIHDSGDFFSLEYLHLWVRIAYDNPSILFYAYTKEVEMFQNIDFELPNNFRYLFSTGGTQDHLINPDIDRHADVFPDDNSIIENGYESQDANDLLAILLPTTRVGIPANNIKHYNKKIAGRRFSEIVPSHIQIRD